MLVIRLQRRGRTNSATFRLVLQEKTQAPKAKAIENLGSYNPHLANRADQIQLNADRITYWLGQGAQTSNTVHNMLIEQGVITGDKRRVVTGKGEPVKETAEAAPATEEKPAA